jgi:hypothetical protein
MGSSDHKVVKKADEGWVGGRQGFRKIFTEESTKI